MRTIRGLFLISVFSVSVFSVSGQTTITKSVAQGAAGSSEWIFNETKIAGAAVDVNSGNKSAGTQRVVIATDQPALTNKLLVTPDSVALPANQSVNHNQVAGTAVDVNSGNKSAGTQRVVIATDQPTMTNPQPVSQNGNWTMRLQGNVGAIIDFVGQNTAAPANSILIGGEFNTTPTTLTTGNASPLQLDNAANLLINLKTAIPTGANTIGAVTQASGPWTENQTQIGGTTIDVNSGNKSAGTQRVVLATDQPALTNKLLVTPDSVALPANQSVNSNQVGGTAIDTNSGTKSAGTQRVVLATDQPALTNKLLVTPDALPANQSVNHNQLAGTAVDVNSGTKSAGTQRVVLATDQPALTNKLLVTPDSVALPANQSVNNNQVAGTAVDVNSGNKSAGTQRVVLATDQPTMSNAQPVTPAATENYLGFVGGKATIVSANFTRPADTTAYASGDLVANSTTAGSVTPMSFTVSRLNDGSGMIRRIILKKSGTTTTNASFRLHLYRSDPSASTGIANGDNGAWSTNFSNWLGDVDLDMTSTTNGRAFRDSASAENTPAVGTELNFIPNAGTQTIYGLLEARAAYTPGNAEVFTAYLEVLQN